MAKIRLSGFAVTQASGKLADNVYARNQHGAYVRTLGLPNFSGTSYQLAMNQQMSTIVAAWTTLTDPERLAWIAAAAQPSARTKNRLAETVSPSGRELFIRLNMQVAGLNVFYSTPPPSHVLQPVQLNSYEISPAGTPTTAILRFSNAVLQTDTALAIWLTYNQSMGIMRPKVSSFKLVRYITTAQFTQDFNINTAVVSRFGPVANLNRSYVMIDHISLISAKKIRIVKALGSAP